MRTEQPTALWPQSLEVRLDDLVTDAAAANRVISAARAGRQRVRLVEPVRPGAGSGRDLAVLRLLTAALADLVDVEWELAEEPPWPARAVVHLPPPATASGAARAYARQWRAGHAQGLCSYRCGPGFVRIRDTRPGGPQQNVLITDDWAEGFRALATHPWQWHDARAERLLASLGDADLALRLDGGTHVLPARLTRWPIPYTAAL